MRGSSLRRNLLLLLSSASLLLAQANGKLQIHFMDVGQGDGAVLISPQGETVLFDNGTLGNCDKPLSYLQQLGVLKIDYHVASHYHSDHIGCTAEVLGQFPLQKDAFDRGGSYKSATFTRYVDVVGAHRKTPQLGSKITLDSGASHPVEIEFVALGGDGIQTTNENDLSLVAVVRFGSFDAEIGGDLSGYKTSSYEDIETGVAPRVGQVEVYKVHHHCSSHSTNNAWLNATKPVVGVISMGDHNGYGHPTMECLERLHTADVKSYWTERGEGAPPEPGFDMVGGNIVVEIEPGAQNFTVTYGGSRSDTYPVWAASGPAEVVPAFAWSKRSEVYHSSTCSYVSNISPANLERGGSPPPGKRLHQGCPR